MKTWLFFLCIGLLTLLGKGFTLGAACAVPPCEITVPFKEIVVKPNTKTIEFQVHVSTPDENPIPIDCQWTLGTIRGITEHGSLQLHLAHQKTMTMAIRLGFPSAIFESEYALTLRFQRDGMPLGLPHTIRLRPENSQTLILQRLQDLRGDPHWLIAADTEEIKVVHEAFTFRIASATASWFLHTKNRTIRLLTEGPCFEIPSEPNLYPLYVGKRQIQAQEVNKELLAEHTIAHASGAIPLQLDTFLSPYGFIDIRAGGTAEALAGGRLGFVIPATLNRIAVLGENTTPGDSALGDVFSLWKEGLAQKQQFHCAEMALFMNPEADGLGVLFHDADVVLRPVPGGTLLLITLEPRNRLWQTLFRLVPVEQGRPSRLFQDMIAALQE
ncbi:MAG: hypothetical protein RBU29_12945 [bacterium]|nr:hypothetical protein [bacterium]